MLLTLVLITIVIFNNTNSNESNIISNTNKDKQVINSNMITMMYETEAASGEYTETADNTWPESGYIFNDTLSGCENGGELEYNSENNTVNLLSHSSDQCYVYFDKYDGVWIDNVVATNVTGSSITLDVSATSENGSITTYYYSLNDSEEYIETTTNPIIIDDLNKLTEYNIKIYAIDNTGAKSNIYEISVSTTDESKPIINSVEVSNITSTGFTLTVNATSDVEIERYYFYVNGNGENQAGTSTTNSYTFNTLNENTNYNIFVYAENINNIYSEKYSLNVMTDDENVLLANYIKELYLLQVLQEPNEIYFHKPSLTNGAEDNSYRYAGANPNNYVCFGSDAISCPNDNLYRIIGVFKNQVKLIKSTSYGSYEWNSERDSTWNSSTKPDIYTTLNSTYYNTLGTTWQNKIAMHPYKVGGFSHYIESTPNNIFVYEVGGYSENDTENMKIGLMYMSDFGYATTNNYWTVSIENYRTAKSSNWLAGLDEWTISKSTGSSGWAYAVRNFGDGVDRSYVTGNYEIRPCFYLNSDVQYIFGTGTQSDPFRIA